MKRTLILLGLTVLCLTGSRAQDLSRSRAHSALDEFRKEARTDFENFRKQCMDDFLSFMRNPWKAFASEAPKPKPKEESVPPQVAPEEDRKAPADDTPVTIDGVVPPQPEVPQPEPAVPIEEDRGADKSMSFTFFGTAASVHFDARSGPKLRGLDVNDIATFLETLEKNGNDRLIHDCLQIRQTRRLSDWAYLQMLQALGEAAYGKGTGEAELLKAYIYCLSGYKMRIAHNGQWVKMLFASRNVLFGLPSFTIAGDTYYCADMIMGSMYVCEAAFPGEKQMSPGITERQQFDMRASEPRTLVSKQFADVRVTSSVNRNLLDFYATYPTSYYGGDIMTRWAMFANTPMQEEVCRSLYPQLRQLFNGRSEYEKVSRLLNLLQTGLEYEYDNKLWGGDRIFFSEESLYYPYCDCEDRAILLTRLVRDLVGLKCILIYYPGHLACAVEFNEDVKGDCILLDGHKFIVCDPTYIGAPVGNTMKGMDNATARVILLQ
ncbi:MAG: hypothetical protein J6X76_00570 [Bacteroidaceae bacterium]|nr:hypothetical protein [Bacteroidaceae bacterium]